MESTSQPSAVAVQELLASLKALYKSKSGTDVTITYVADDDLEYELEYNTDSAEDKVPNMSIHACMWDAGDHLGINGLKVAAADKFKVALSQFNIYGAEMNFSFLFFEGLVKDVEAVWDELVWRSNRILLGQLSMHIQSNIKEWADKKGAQARFVESSYRLTFREIQQQPRCSESMLQVIRAKYQDYLEAETGHAALQH